ncbi:MAG TPA: NADH-quinone oxidoreductase subunit L [Syntrophorhabdaceae bacterium]|nr:NADH-quinone oxidoreductase subunit L [Syntrophorhabdaceae bacterium]
MFELLPLIPALPFVGFLVLICAGSRIGRSVAPLIGTGTLGASALCAILVCWRFVAIPPASDVWTRTFWVWFKAGGLAPTVGFYVDFLSLAMIVVITLVGFLIHLYSMGFMASDEGINRFFAYMNLFVGSMLVLVLADNLLLLYLGWEGVGLCSYLLIGFWYKDPDNVRAAMKAFIVTRIGDAAMVVGLFLIYRNLGTLAIPQVFQGASAQWPAASPIALAVASLLLAGAVGKSAQIPLQTWLPDAMAGPTPVSALIHAATMVAAGVYLIARMHPLFELAPAVLTVVAIIGAATLLIGATSALSQRDIKRVLAYSTLSQIGYMFLALGVKAWSAAIFHFMTHAFFKALLFLAAGVVIKALGGEHDMFKMGGLKRRIPLAFWTFLIGAASLSALPLVTAGFYSKELILVDVFASASSNWWLFAAGLIGAFLTSLYSFRVVFLVFFGASKSPVSSVSGRTMSIPLVCLSFLSLTSGFLALPETFPGPRPFLQLLERCLPPGPLLSGLAIPHTMLMAVASAVSVSGIYLAYQFYFKNARAPSTQKSSFMKTVHLYWFSGWGFDWLYETCLVRPFIRFVRVNKEDAVDVVFEAIAHAAHTGSVLLSYTQSGKVRYYAAAILLGAIVFLAMVLLS